MDKTDIHKQTLSRITTKTNVSYFREKTEFIFLHKETFLHLERYINGSLDLYMKSHRSKYGKAIVTEIRKAFNFSPKTFDWDILNSFYKEYKLMR